MFSLSLPMWFTLLLIILSVLHSFGKPKKVKLPPGPLKLPLIGSMLHLLGGLPHRILYKLSKKYGPITQIQLGVVPIVAISSPQAAEKVLKTFEANCCSRPQVLGAQKITYNYSDLGFSPYNDHYKEMKKICNNELFSAQKLHTFRFIREEEVAFLIDLISQLCPSATSVDLSEKLMSFTTNLICRVAFGKSFPERGFNNVNHQVIEDVTQTLEFTTASDFFPFWGWIIDKFTGINSRFQRSFLEMDSFCQKLIDDRLNDEKQTQEHEDFVDVLLKMQTKKIGSDAVQLTDEQIKALLVDVFTGGVETTATAMVWAMAELARNPNVMKKAQEEIRYCIRSKGKVSESDIDELHYLKALVKETLRLHPVVPLILREATNQFKLEGYDIYPHSYIEINNWALGRDPSIWERPEEFIPERFIGSSIDFKGQYFEFLPFGSGRRICPGMHMAMKNIEITLANLLHCFDWKLPSGMKPEDINMEEQFGVVSRKKIALKLVPVKYA